MTGVPVSMTGVSVSPAAIAAALGQFPPTAEQAEVIAAPLAPALVVAGAGSGKTETMAARVVWLVANGRVRRDQVLGLTFTRKAAGELAERIGRRLARLGEFERRGLLPNLPILHERGRLDVFGELERAGAPEAERRARLDDLAREVAAADPGAVPGSAGSTAASADGLLDRPMVATYNSFADAIVRENAVRAGRDAEAAVLSEPAAWLLMRRVVFDSDDPRLEVRDEALRSIVDAALRIARDGVDNLADLDDVAAYAARFAEIEKRPSQNRRTIVYKDVADAVTRVGGLAVLVALAREYQARKRRLGVIDFSDQVAGAFEVVHGHAAVAEELRDRYRIVLLDEYQDTSVLQTRLLAAAFAGTAVMAVGDPHQSIYGWRGASAGNLGGFAAAFAAPGEARPGERSRECERYSLMTSWRSSARVLTAADAVLAPLAASSPLPVEPLRARPGAPRGEVTFAFESDIDAEADRVAEWFAGVRSARLAAGRATTGAVLFRGKKHMGRFADALARRGIPHRILGLGGLLSTPEVVDVVAALRVLSDPQAGSALIRLLAGPRWSIGLADLRALGDLARRLARHDAALQPLPPQAIGDDRGSLVEALDFVLRQPPGHGWLNAFTDEARTRLREAAAVFAGLRRSAALPIPELVRLIEAELRLDIELAANEARGPVRLAGDQLRAFVDELHGFLSTDESGSLPSLLAWLDRAERLDEFAPRTEPPEDDVVQLLTIHGSKGLEWDAVAVVRLVEDELPTRLRDGKGWLSFGILPYDFRGDAPWLPALRWSADAAPTQQDLKGVLDEFGRALRTRHVEEERRLAYVAVTRARDNLLLSGSSWSGTKSSRPPSRFLGEIAEALGLPEVGLAADEQNPYLGRRETLQWPMDPLGARREVVHAAADAVRAAQARPPVPASRDLDLLLAERSARADGGAGAAPVRIPASRFKDFAGDYAGTVAALARPMPERPYRQTRLGTLFHSWVEKRSGLSGSGGSLDDPLWQVDPDEDGADVPGGAVSGDLADGDGVALEPLMRNFLASEWADLRPLEVEAEIDFADDELAGSLLGDNRPHVVICKLDAVYRRDDGRIEIVDWKTGRPPRTAREREERMLQLELYRRAYHAGRGVPLDQIDVALYYVADDLVIRG